MNDERLKTLKEVAEQIERPAHRIIHICETGLVHPRVDAEGRGSVRRFSREDVFRVLVALVVQEAGVQVPLIKPLMRALDDFMALFDVQRLQAKLDHLDVVSAIGKLSSTKEPIRAYLISPQRAALIVPNLEASSYTQHLPEIHRDDHKLVDWPVAIVINLTALARLL